MKKKILFVCLGNICRSPTGEGVFKNLVKSKNLNEKYSIDSAGTNGLHNGEHADARMQKHALKRGIQLNSISRQLKEQDFKDFDIIIAMDDSNVRNIKMFNPSGEYHYKIHKMTDYSISLNYDEVPDPYYGGEAGFELVLDIIEDACKGLLANLENK